MQLQQLFAAALALVGAAYAAQAQQIVTFPEAANVIDITKAPYNAIPNDGQDDTAAIQKALNERQRLIYLPEGVYDVSETLKWGPRQTRQIIQGQSESGTIIRLRDASPAFGTPTQPKPVIWTGEAPAQRFRNGIRNLTVDTGMGNPGAIGVQFIANNQGGMHRVTIRSGDADRAGVIGLDLGYTNEQGPCLIKHVTIEGFDVGLSARHTVDSIVVEHLKLRGQRKIGLLNDGQCVAIRGLHSDNAVPALLNRRGQGLVAIIDSELIGRDGAGNHAAIENEAGLFARNVKVTGYATSIENSAGHQRKHQDLTIDEFVSHEPLSLFPSPARSLALPIEETPEPEWDPPQQWTSVAAFAPAEPPADYDWTEALQAAIDSGATTVFFPNRSGRYSLFGTVHVRNKVRHIIGLESVLEPAKGRHPVFVIDEGDAPTVVIERFDWLYTHAQFIHRSARTLVLRSMAAHQVSTDPGAGKLFLEDMVFGDLDVAKGTRVWARQLNLEGWEEPKSLNAGGDLWILGLKTETDTTPHQLTTGGRSEVIGGFLYSNKAQMQPKQMFINDGGSLSFTVGETTSRKQPFDIVIETRPTRLADDKTAKYGKVRRILRHGQAYPRGDGSMIPLYTGYWIEPLATSGPTTSPAATEP